MTGDWSDSGENIGGRGSSRLLEDTEDFLSSGDRDIEGELDRGKACFVAHSST